MADTPPRGSRIPGARTTLTGTGRGGTTAPMATVTPPPPEATSSDGWNLEGDDVDQLEGGATSADLLRRKFVDESGLRTSVNAAPTNKMMPAVRQRVSTPGSGTPTSTPSGGPDVQTSTTLRDLPAVQPRALFGSQTPATATSGTVIASSPPPATAPAGGATTDDGGRARVRDVPMPEPAGSARKTAVDQPLPASVAAAVAAARAATPSTAAAATPPTAATIPATSSATAAATSTGPSSATADAELKRAPTRIVERVVASSPALTPTAAPPASDSTSVGPPPSAPASRSTAPGGRDEETSSGRARVEVARHVLTGELDPRLVLLTEPDSPRSASFRVLRHRLAESGNPRLIAVSSPERGDGKTMTAANLALALGERGRARVLLVEANLRTPDLATVFGFLPPTCFARQLAAHREHPLDPWTVVEIADRGLHVAAIHPDTPRGALVDGVALGVALAALPRAGYDYVVIDTPAVLGAADVNLVADYAHGVLLVSRAGKTTARALRRAVEQVAPAHLLGLMLLDA